MAKKHEKKTNAMRELDRIGAAYDTHIWDCAEAMSGVEVADHLALRLPAYSRRSLPWENQAPIMSSWCRLLKSST